MAAYSMEFVEGCEARLNCLKEIDNPYQNAYKAAEWERGWKHTDNDLKLSENDEEN